MNQLLSKYKQDFDEVRRLCLQCHGLDLTTTTLFATSTYTNPSANTKSVLDSLLSSGLLNLAVAIRINIYQGWVNGAEESLDMDAASYYYDDEMVAKCATIKEVCDKIIHADSVTKPIFPRELLEHDVKLTFQFKGSHYRQGWTLNLCLVLFTESVLNLLDRIESQSPPAA